jgi:hypothetical protein
LFSFKCLREELGGGGAKVRRNAAERKELVNIRRN